MVCYILVDSIVQERLRSNGPSIEYWNDLKSTLRRRHIPSYYNRELMNKLQRLQQRNMFVEEYTQKMELLMMRAGIIEEESITISRFLSGLNLDIRDRVELLPYQDLNDLVQIWIKVEQKYLRKYFSKRNQAQTNSYVKKDFKKEEKKEEPPTNLGKGKDKEGSASSHTRTSEIKCFKCLGRGHIASQHTRTSEIKCFKCLGRGHIASQCPTKKTMILRGVDSYNCQDENESESGSEESNESNIEDAHPCDGDLLMVRRILNNQPSPRALTQRENIVARVVTATY